MTDIGEGLSDMRLIFATQVDDFFGVVAELLVFRAIEGECEIGFRVWASVGRERDIFAKQSAEGRAAETDERFDGGQLPRIDLALDRILGFPKTFRPWFSHDESVDVV